MEKKKSKAKIFIILALVIAILAAGAAVVMIYVVGPANEYKDAEALRDSGNYVEAAAAFAAMGDYEDAPEQVLLCNYKEAQRLETEGRKAAAAMAYGALGDYEDARARSFALWEQIVPRATMDMDSDIMMGLREDGSVICFYESENEGRQLDTPRQIVDAVEVAAGRFDSFVLTKDGWVWKYDRSGAEVFEGWTDIVDLAVSGDLMDGDSVAGLRADGTVVYKASVLREDDRGQGNVGGWRNIVSVKCSTYITAGLRANGTVIATGLLTEDEREQIRSWTDIVAIEVGSFHMLGLRADGTVAFAGNTEEAYSKVDGWKNVIALSASSNCTMGLTADGKVLHAGSQKHEACLEWTGITAIDAEYSGSYGLKQDGRVLLTAEQAWFQPVGTWTNIRQPACYGFYDLDHEIQVDAAGEEGSFTPEAEEPFTNKYGTRTTTCAHPNCAAYIATSGDTNCCPWHSNRCGNCRCYIDEDAMYCMDCLRNALD